MKISIGKFDAATGQVAVTFEEGVKRHSRTVNAVLGEGGKYDRKATRTRIEEVAEGVAHKFGMGLIATVEQLEAEA